MSVLKKEFVSKDGKIKIDGIIYSDKDIWLNIVDIQTFYGKHKEGDGRTITIKSNKKIKKQKFIITKEEQKTTKECVNIGFLEKLYKIAKNQYLKEFIKWAKKIVYERIWNNSFIKGVFYAVKIPKIFRLLGSLILPIIFSSLYYKFNLNKEIVDLSLNILGLNFALIIFNIPILIKVNEWNNEEIKELLKKTEVPNSIGAKLTIKNATLLSVEMLLTLILSSIIGIMILVFNITLIWKNTLSIFVLILTLWHTFHIVWRVYIEQKRNINSNQENDMFTNEEIEKEITKWIN